ncbi:stationary phase inducible protein CsiE [Serratia marcescens]|uniref:Stationary phase inducible protein CsiE n=1 Tax=Serratia marcescens TaxID=615 RepID=A0A379YTG2_SERMA|nr:stationary phase inducible protein CsiE [Serratia marcescens]
MSLDTSPVPALSGQQRRCHLLLMLYTPEPELQLETLKPNQRRRPPDNPARYSRGSQ